MELLDWTKFADRFHPSWEKKVRPFIESPECAEIYAQLRAARERGKKVVPDSSQTYRAFKETNLDEIKAAFFGLSPYHTLKDKKIVADGILMSCSNTGHLAPSLEQFYNAMERELYPDGETTILRNPDLAYLCREGVFMGNISLTCEIMKAGSHIKIWEPFVKYLLQEVLSPAGIPFVWLGKDASVYDKHVNPFLWRFKLSHPASAAYNHTQWNSENVFKNVSKVVNDYTGQSIRWAETLPF